MCACTIRDRSGSHFLFDKIGSPFFVTLKFVQDKSFLIGCYFFVCIFMYLLPGRFLISLNLIFLGYHVFSNTFSDKMPQEKLNLVFGSLGHTAVYAIS